MKLTIFIGIVIYSAENEEDIRKIKAESHLTNLPRSLVIISESEGSLLIAESGSILVEYFRGHTLDLDVYYSLGGH